MSLEFVALDFETANRRHGSPCQVGLALVRDGRVEATWGSLMRPPHGRDWFDPDCSQVHGIVERDLAGQPTFEQLWPEIERRLARRPVVAHNAAFDISVIREATSHCGYEWPTLEFGCSLLLSRRWYDLPEHTLDAVAGLAGIRLERHHDAVQDAVACALVVLDIARRAGASSLDELLRVSGLSWGRLSAGEHQPCRPVRRASLPVGDLVGGACAPTLF